MAQVSSGSFTTSTFEGRGLKFNWSVNKTSVAENYKEIYWSLVGTGGSGYHLAGNFKVVIDGETVYNSSTRIELWNGTVVASGYKKIYANNAGNKSFKASVEAGIYNVAVNCSGSGSWELPTIPRYATITKYDLSKRDETSLQFTWGADKSCDAIQYSLNNGGWIDGLYPTTVVGGLSANTSYSIKIRVKAKDSQLWTESGNKSETTYNYPHCISAHDFKITTPLTLDFYNPLGRAISVKGYSNNTGAEIFNGATAGTRLIGFNDVNSVNKQYASLHNCPAFSYKVVVEYGGVSMTYDEGDFYEVRGDELPVINEFRYFDGHPATVSLSGNDKHIIQEQSIFYVVGDASARYGASGISKYIFECNGAKMEQSTAGAYYFNKIYSNRDVDLKLTVVDSRGLSVSKTVKVTVLEYSGPTANVTLQRVNNYEDETHLTVDGSVSSVNGNNTMTIRYRYKASGGNYGAFTTIGDNQKQILSLDKSVGYIFNVVVNDALGTEYNKEFTLEKGIFPLFIDTQLNSVGVNKFPMYNKSFEAKGLMSLGEREVYEVNAGESIEIPVFLSLCSGLVNFRIQGANLEIARLYYVFRSNQYFGVHKAMFDESYGNTSAVVPVEMQNTEQGYIFRFTNNHSSAIYIRYGIFELC